MNYNHLYYFYVAAKSGGITIAADNLHISQPSLSSQLKVLEESLDLKLFEKVGRKNQLTPTGEMIYGYCKQMFELSEKMAEVVNKNTPTSKRKIQIGVTSEIEKEFVTEVVSRFLNHYPVSLRPQVNLVSTTLNQLIEQVRYKEVDTIITSQIVNESEFMSIKKIDVPVVLCCSSKWNNSSFVNSSDNDLVIDALVKCDDVQWVLPSSHFHLREQIDKFFEEKHIPKRIVFESDSLSALVRSVHNELGFSFLPLLHVNNELKGKYLKQLGSTEGFWKYNLTLGSHSQYANDEIVKSFSKAFVEFCESSQPAQSDVFRIMDKMTTDHTQVQI